MRKIFIISLALLASVGICAESGKCGKTLKWNLTDSVMTISGTGSMNDYTNGDAPWMALKESIKEVVIKEGVSTVGVRAFEGCKNIQKVSFPESLLRIEEKAFYASTLFRITIPKNVKYIGKNAFSECWIVKVQWNAERCEVPYDKNVRNRFFYHSLVMPSFSFGDQVKSIPAGLCTMTGPDILEVVVPEGVTEIGENAFQDVINVVYHGDREGAPWGARYANAFVDNNWVYADSGKTHIIDIPYSYSSDATIPSTVTNIGAKLFQGERDIDIHLPQNLRYIGDSAFADCEYVLLFLNSTLSAIGDGAFDNVESLNIVHLGRSSENPTKPYGYREGPLVFADSARTILLECWDKEVEEVEIPTTVRIIETNAFSGCYRIRSLRVPSSVSRIENNAFVGVLNVEWQGDEEYLNKSGQKYINGYVEWPFVYSDASKKELVACSSLPMAHLEVPASVQKIYGGVFSYSRIDTLVLPKSILWIGEGNFTFYPARTTIINAANPPVNESIITDDEMLYFYERENEGFTNDDAIPVILVPKEALRKYEEMECWQNYIIRPIR